MPPPRSKYKMRLTIDIDEQDQYGKDLSHGSVSYTKDIAASSLAELGKMLQDVDNITDNKPAV